MGTGKAIAINAVVVASGFLVLVFLEFCSPYSFWMDGVCDHAHLCCQYIDHYSNNTFLFLAGGREC